MNDVKYVLGVKKMNKIVFNLLVIFKIMVITVLPVRGEIETRRENPDAVFAGTYSWESTLASRPFLTIPVVGVAADKFTIEWQKIQSGSYSDSSIRHLNTSNTRTTVWWNRPVGTWVQWGAPAFIGTGITQTAGHIPIELRSGTVLWWAPGTMLEVQIDGVLGPSQWAVATETIRLDGVLVSERRWDPVRGFGAIHPWWTTRIILHDPIFDSLLSLDKVVGDAVNWVEGISGHWGLTTHNTIPLPVENGKITNLSLNLGTDSTISTDGLTYDGVGRVVHEILLQDAHALRTDGMYTIDNTYARRTRVVTVRTGQGPLLNITYSNGAAAADGQNISGAYSPSLAENPCGGEAGWTNQPLDITVDPSSILGTFDTVVQLPGVADVVNTNDSAVHENYHIQSDTTDGSIATGFLSEIGNTSNKLSSTETAVMKIDTTPPEANALHDGGFRFTDDSTDDLSGMSLSRPTQIAFTTPNVENVPPTEGWEPMDSHTMNTPGTYDIWIRATDKAGNTHTVKTFANHTLSGEVIIHKDTNMGATLHTILCQNADDISIASCDTGCSIGAKVVVQEKSELTYLLTLTNTDNADGATGSFEDYLPKGTVISTMPVANPVSAVTNLDFQIVTDGEYAGQYKVTGNYTLLAGAQVEIEILCKLPAFDKLVASNNRISNQANLDWEMGTGLAHRVGTSYSNFAVHELIEISGVETSFTKVGADDITTGITGAEFALYKWTGTNPPTIEESNHMVDPSVLVDSTFSAGDWVRVTYGGEEAELTDIFITADTPLGEVDLGILPTGTYTLIETKAPTGYHLPVGQWILTIDSDKTDTAADDWKIEIVGKSNSIAPPAAIRDESVPNAPTYKIVNAEPFLIGLSGLGGTTGMLLTGFVLMAIAGNTYLVCRYKRNQKQETKEFSE